MGEKQGLDDGTQRLYVYTYKLNVALISAILAEIEADIGYFSSY
jgi:hypothetical protein